MRQFLQIPSDMAGVRTCQEGIPRLHLYFNFYIICLPDDHS